MQAVGIRQKAAGRGTLVLVGFMAAVMVAVAFFFGVGSYQAPASGVNESVSLPAQGPSDQDALPQLP